jgi:hypothetical protein
MLLKLVYRIEQCHLSEEQTSLTICIAYHPLKHYSLA